MTVLDERGLLKKWLESLIEQYHDVLLGFNPTQQLRALNPETATEAEIRAIIGGKMSDGCGSYQCDFCKGLHHQVVSSVTDEDEGTTWLCLDCARMAVTMLEGTA